MSVNLSSPVVPRDFSAIGNWFEVLFRSFFAEIKVWLLQSFITLVLTSISMIVLFAVVIIAFFPNILHLVSNFVNPSFLQQLQTNPELSQSMQNDPAFREFMLYFINHLPMIIGIFILIILLQMVIQTYFSAGMTYTALKQQSGEPIAVGDLFGSGFLAALRITGASFIAMLILLLPLVCFVLPALFVAPIFLFIIPIIIDRRAGVFESISQSFDIVKKNYWLFFVYMIVMGATIFVSSLVLQLVGGALQEIYMPLGFLFNIAVRILLTPITVMFTVVAYSSMLNHSQQATWDSGPPQYIPPAYTPPPATVEQPQQEPAPEPAPPENENDL